MFDKQEKCDKDQVQIEIEIYVAEFHWEYFGTERMREHFVNRLMTMTDYM